MENGVVLGNRIHSADHSRKNGSGLIFNIMRFSTHDGPGIRTTVFFKGCPLSCWWCHNPENWNHVPSEVYLPDRCIGCGLCIQNCTAGALFPRNRRVLADPKLCRHCGRCVEVCPVEARELTVRKVSVADLKRFIERDIPFYDQSGGGVTFSGGEPLCQPEFLIKMLEICRQMEIHRIVDTSGYAAEETLFQVARITDLFLYDIKLMDPTQHQINVGVDNVGILNNLRRLSEWKAQVVIRIPLIPGVNDGDDNIAQTGEFIAGLPERHPVNLLPYHGAADSKYAKLGISYEGARVGPLGKNRIAGIARNLSDFGLQVSVGG